MPGKILSALVLFPLAAAAAELPPEVGERIAWKNGEALFASKK
jgi:hypothetical protein